MVKFDTLPVSGYDVMVASDSINRNEKYHVDITP